MLQCMTRVDLPIVVVQITYGEQRQYRGRLATKDEFEEYRRTCGVPPSDITCEIWPVSTITGSTQGTRLSAHEVREPFATATLGQIIHARTGPFNGQQFRLVGTLSNKFDKFFFGQPLPL